MTSSIVDHTPLQLTASENLSKRATALLKRDIDFIPNAEFSEDDCLADKTVEEMLGARASKKSAPADLPAHLRRMCEAELLTHEQEANMFREMNLLKFKANALRAQIDPDCVEADLLDSVVSFISSSLGYMRCKFSQK